jgi:RNA polymerase sigma-32 factor
MRKILRGSNMNQALACYGKSLSVGSLNAYIEWVHQIPMLTAEEEQDLALRLKTSNDLEAARQLVMSHLRFVVKVARGYSGYGLLQADLIQEGNIGLMKAVKRFDHTIGVRLISFAVHWIRAEIHEFILRNWRIVKVATTKAQRKLFFNLRKASKKRGWFSEQEINTVAEELKVSHKAVREMEARLNHYDQSLETFGTDDENSIAPIDFLEDSSANPEHLLEHNDWQSSQEEKLSYALELLDDRSKEILKQRWLNEEKLTLHELAARYQISAERIRQLEKNALKKLRDAISEQ